MAKSAIINVTSPDSRPVPVATVSLGPGKWEVSHSEGNSRDTVILIARRVADPEGGDRG